MKLSLAHGILCWNCRSTSRAVHFFYDLLTVHLSIISVINQLDAQNFCFVISLLYASTCFEHYVLIIRRSKFYYTASGIITLCRWPSGAQVERGRDGHLQSTMIADAV